MQEISIKLTVFFDGQFWNGVFEKTDSYKYGVVRIVFGPEPKDYEVHTYLLKNFYYFNFNNSIKADDYASKKINPKKLQKNIRKETKCIGIGTKAQMALKLQHEKNKNERKVNSRLKNEYEKEKLFQIKKEKKKQKHKGH